MVVVQSHAAWANHLYLVHVWLVAIGKCEYGQPQGSWGPKAHEIVSEGVPRVRYMVAVPIQGVEMSINVAGPAKRGVLDAFIRHYLPVGKVGL